MNVIILKNTLCIIKVQFYKLQKKNLKIARWYLVFNKLLIFDLNLSLPHNWKVLGQMKGLKTMGMLT
jgi:hypothetical protein